MLQLHRPTPLACETEAPAPRERRRFRRSPLNERVRLCGTGLSPVAELIDGSAGGLFLRIDGARRPEAGEDVQVNFEAGDRGGPAHAHERREARVVRCLSHAGAHYVAVRFAAPDTLRLRVACLG